MARPTVDAFLDFVRRSGLVEKDRLNDRLLELKCEAEDSRIGDADLMANWLVEADLLTRWQADRLLEGRHKGFFLGKYKLLGLLATGGMSSVYLAQDVQMQRRVAIKVLPKNRVEDTSYLARFHREAHAAAALDHRNIVRAYGGDHQSGIHYFVMEYIEGRDLQRIVHEDGPLDYPSAAEYIRQAAEGLSYAHGSGVIHRDVKPANMLVDQNSVIKLLDLGLARFADKNEASLTLEFDENVLGTADYLAPEQALDSHAVDVRADVYGLGCSMYFVLTGHPPFVGGTLAQRLMRHQNESPPSIFLDRPDAPADLVEICVKMMAKDPDDRYQSAADAAMALASWLAAREVTVPFGVSERANIIPSEVSTEAKASSPPRPVEQPTSVQRTCDEAEVLLAVPPLPDPTPSLADTSSGSGSPTTKGPAQKEHLQTPLDLWMELEDHAVAGIPRQVPRKGVPLRTWLFVAACVVLAIVLTVVFAILH